MKTRREVSGFYKTIFATSFLFLSMLGCACFVVRFFGNGVEEIPVIAADDESWSVPKEDVFPHAENVSWKKADRRKIPDRGIDSGLDLYRDPETHGAVKDFYVSVTGDYSVADAILKEADDKHIPLALAFALCYSESRYNRFARNTNGNGSIDRGLFQLNDRSFEHLKLSNEKFYEPETNARYGLGHLRFCLDTSGKKDSVALAMYNAGITRVRNRQIPPSTVRYVEDVIRYKNNLILAFNEYMEEKFSEVEQIVSVR